MPSTSSQEVNKLNLDLKNYRTVPQKKEKDAIKAMITIKPERFYAMMKSIIENGFLPTENIIVLKEGTTLTVKEGNRRIAALKLIHGHYKIADFDLPTDIVTLVKTLDKTWKQENLKVPCAIYNKNESEMADRVVALAHGKGEQASRDKWESVATARHNRDAKGIAEPALDLLEKYLKVGKNLTDEQKERWGGVYPITVLAEAMRFIFPRLGFTSFSDFIVKYPKISELSQIENLFRDIGLELIGFKSIRDTHSDFALGYGFAPITPATVTTPSSAKGSGTPTTASTPIPVTLIPGNANTNAVPSGSTMPISAVQPAKSASKRAVATNDPKHIAALLRSFNPKGKDREKVVTLRDEIKKLDIQKTPIAFCFLLRSMFEISSKAYCTDHRISLTKPAKIGKLPQDKTLAELLKDITGHLTTNNTDKAKAKILHGASTEISKTTGILSITSMNQLVHNPKFSVTSSDICTLFGNIYPLLEAMNL